MGSLNLCLGKLRKVVDRDDADTIRKLYKEYTTGRGSMQAQEAQVEAVRSVLEQALADREQIALQIERAGGVVPPAPGEEALVGFGEEPAQKPQKAQEKAPEIERPSKYEGEPLSDEEIDALVENWKYVQEVERKGKPKSLSSWVIDRGGLKDDAKEVRQIAGAAKERPGLINKDGMNLDDAARAAWEDGYFTGDRPTVADFLEKLQDDLHTGDVVRAGDEAQLEDIAAANDMAVMLGEYGIDTNRFRSEKSVRNYFGQEWEAPASEKPEKVPQEDVPFDGADEEGLSIPARIEKLKKKLITFASGMSRINDFKNGSNAVGGLKSVGVGVDVGELSQTTIEEIARAVVDWKTQVFIDSGAFSLFRRNMRTNKQIEAELGDLFGDVKKVHRRITSMNFEDILKKYDDILGKIGEYNAAEETVPPPLIVMPDVVGDQKASLELVKKYAFQIKTEADFNLSKPIIPIQKGEVSLVDAYNQIVATLGTDNFITGIPSNEKAISNKELVDFLKEAKPKGIHFLGAASQKNLAPKIEAIAKAGYEPEHLSADGNILRSALYGKPVEGTRGQNIRNIMTDKGGKEFDEAVEGPKSEEEKAQALLDRAWEIHDEIEEIGRVSERKDIAGFAKGMKGRLESGTSISETSVKFYEQRLEEYKGQISEKGEKPDEVDNSSFESFIGKDKYLRRNWETVQKDGSPEVKDVLKRWDAKRKELMKALNAKGFAFANVNSSSPQDVQNIRSGFAIDGLISRIINQETARIKEWKRADAQALKLSLDEFERDMAGDVIDRVIKGEANLNTARIERDAFKDKDKPKVEDDMKGVVATFKTAKGSDYKVFSDGTTIRNKAARDDLGHEGDSGIKPRTDATYYVTKEQADELSLIQTQGGGKMAIQRVGSIAGAIGVKYLDGKDAGKFEKRTVVKYKADPEVDLIPVEVWDGGTIVHFGNKIVNVEKIETEKAPEKSKYEQATERAKQIVMEKGAKDGREHAVLVTPNGGLFEVNDPDNSHMSMRLGDDNAPTLYMESVADRSVDIHHNHPGKGGTNASLSDADILALFRFTKARSVIAHTTNGDTFIGVAKIHPDNYPKKKDGTPYDPRDEVRPIVENVMVKVGSHVRRRNSIGVLALPPAEKARYEELASKYGANHFFAGIYSRIGLIDYEVQWSSAKSQRENEELERLVIRMYGAEALAEMEAKVKGIIENELFSGAALNTEQQGSGVAGVRGPASEAPEGQPGRPGTEVGPEGGTETTEGSTGVSKTDVEEKQYLKIVDKLLKDGGFKTILEARKFAQEAGITGSRKELDEAIETAVVMAARIVVAESQGAEKTFSQTYDRLVKLYDAQPNLNVRTSTSVANQAYSTPMPLAYVASRLGGVYEAGAVFEPSAGNGALLIEAVPDLGQVVVANELDPARERTLKRWGFVTRNMDATSPLVNNALRDVGGADVVIMNPPFGAVKEDGKSKVWSIKSLSDIRDDGKPWKTTNVDHAIAFNTLEAMKDNGRAVLIVGGVNAETMDERAKGYLGKAKREFYYNLYKKFNVVDHFTVSGDLYKKQGAGWPVDVIVIEGRGESKRKHPSVEIPELINSWESLKGKLEDGRYKPESLTNRRPAGGTDTGVPGGSTISPDAGPSAAPSGSRPDVVQPEEGGQSETVHPERGGREPGYAPENTGDEATSSRPDRDGTRTGDVPVADDIKPRVKRERKEGESQVPYDPVSRGKALDTLIPVNMGDSARDALERIARQHGSLDKFVAAELKFDPNSKEFKDAFGAEQIDAIALAIHNQKNGAAFIIGDQTGIGKGRTVAGMLRYALVNKMIPVFVTEKPDLYGDIYRDLTDTKIQQFLGREPTFLTTNNSSGVGPIGLDEKAVEWRSEYEAHKKRLEESALEEVESSKKGLSGKEKEAAVKEAYKRLLKEDPLPKKEGKFLTPLSAEKTLEAMNVYKNGDRSGADFVLTTYDQMNTVKGQTTPRRDFLAAISPDAMIVFDESHNAGGTGTAAWGEEGSLNRSKFARMMADKAKGVMFSSATYAKRPDVMDLYARTDMGKAVKEAKELPDLIKRGGVPMQQIVASMLAKAGQYLRRERSFEGVKYDLNEVSVDQKSYQDFSGSMSNIFNFDMFVETFKDQWIRDWLENNGETISFDGGIGQSSADSTSFGSLMHNVVNQMLLAIKADPAAEAAIAAHKNGEKPIIALANTNESFIQNFAKEEGISTDEVIDLDFRALLERYLERTLRFTVKHPSGRKEHVFVPVKDLPPAERAMYDAALKSVRDGAFQNLPISPVDWIRHRLEQAGMSVREVTGRQTMIDYSDGKKYVKRPSGEMKATGKRASIAAFNSGKLDALILNRSGSTGVSMHAAKNFKDKRRRHMILAQAEGNIDTHLQMLGRVHRTGQVITPTYTQLAADIPAEARPTAVLMKKMASLNANTTGARSSAFTVDAVDFMNEIGDKIVASYLYENSDVNAKLGHPLQINDDGKMVINETARKATGRLVLLSQEEQVEFLDAVAEAYTKEIQSLDAMGENPLEAKTVDLQARTEEVVELRPKTGDTPFTDAVRLEKVSAKSQGRAMALSDVVGHIVDSVSQEAGIKKPGTGDAIKDLQILERQGADWGYKEIRRVGEHIRKQNYAEVQSTKTDSAAANTRRRLDDQFARWNATMRVVLPGARVRLGMPSGDMNGIVMSIERTGKAKNMGALGSWTVKIAVPDSARQIEFPLSKLYPEGYALPEDEKGATIAPARVQFQELNNQFEEARKEGRETRYILTGNVLGGFDETKGRGRILNFTTDKGEIRPGILMSREFSVDKFMSSRAIRMESGEQVAKFLDTVPPIHAYATWSDAEVKSTGDNADVSMGKDKYGYYISMAAAKAKAGHLFTDKKVRDALFPSEFERRRGKMSVDSLSREKFVKVIDAMKSVGVSLEVTDHQEIAQEVVKTNTKVDKIENKAADLGKYEAITLDDTGPDFASLFNSVTRGKVYEVPSNNVIDQMMGTKEISKALPSDAIFGILERAEPVGEPKIDLLDTPVKMHFVKQDGTSVTITLPISRVAGLRAFTFTGGRSNAVLLLNLGFFDDLVETSRGVIAHESIHVLHNTKVFTDREWSSLVRHAKSLHVLDMSNQDYLRIVGDKAWENAEKDSLTQMYAFLYSDRPNKLNLIQQENVAHMTELWVRGYYSDEDVGPVLGLLKDIVSGRISGNTEEDLDLADFLENMPTSATEDTTPEPYYSAALRAAYNLTQEKGTPGQMLEALKRSGARPAEIKALGLNEFVESKDKISKSEIADFIEAGVYKLEVNEAESPNWQEYSLDPENETYKETSVELKGNYAVVSNPRESFGVERVAIQDRSGNYVLDSEGKPAFFTKEQAAARVKKLNEKSGVKPHIGGQNVVAHLMTSEVEVNPEDVLGVEKLNAIGALIADAVGVKDHKDLASGIMTDQRVISLVMEGKVTSFGLKAYAAYRKFAGYKLKGLLTDQIQSDWAQTYRKALNDYVAMQMFGETFNSLYDQEKADVKVEIAAMKDRGELDNLKLYDEETIDRLSREVYDLEKREKETLALAGKLHEANARIHARAKERELANIQADLKITRAELDTVKNGVFKHPLIENTDSWLNIVMPQIARLAYEARADVIITPSGDSVVDYNQSPSKIAGMQGFYGSALAKNEDGIVYKSAKKYLSSRGILAGSPHYTDQVVTPSDGKAGSGFTVFPLNTFVLEDDVNLPAPLFAKYDAKKPKATDSEPIAQRYAPKVEGAKLVEVEDAIREAVGVVRTIAGPNVEIDMRPKIYASEIFEDAGPEEELGGYYTPASNPKRVRVNGPALIHLAYSVPQFNLRESATHEAWHHAERTFATPQEMKLLRNPRELERMRRMAAEGLGLPLDNKDVQELPAYEVTAYAFQHYVSMKQEGGGAGLHIGIRRFFDKVANALIKLRNALVGLGYKSYKDIFEEAASGRMAKRPPRNTAPKTAENSEANLARVIGNIETVLKNIVSNAANGNESVATHAGAFARQRVIFEQGSNVSEDEMYKAYRVWAREAGVEVAGPEEFRRSAVRYGELNILRIDGKANYIGVRLAKPTEAQKADPSVLTGPEFRSMAYLISKGMSAVQAMDRVTEAARSTARGVSDVERVSNLEALRNELSNDNNLDSTIYENVMSLSEGSGPQATRLPKAMKPASQKLGVIGRSAARVLGLNKLPALDDVRVAIQDKALPIRRVAVEDVSRKSGEEIPVNLDTYVMEAIYHGRAGERMKDLNEQHVQPLLEFMRENDLDMDTFGDYLYARHAAERNEYIQKHVDPENDMGSGMTNEEASDILDEIAASGKQDQYAAAADRVYALQGETLDRLRNSGLIDEETYDEWKYRYENYVPLRGFEANEEENPDRMRAGRGFDVRGKESMQALGRKSKSDNPVLYSVMAANQSIVRSEKNRVAKTLYKMVKKHPDPTKWKIYKGKYMRRINPKTGFVEKKFVAPAWVREDSIFGVKIGGQVHWIELKDPSLARAMRGVGHDIQSTALARVFQTTMRTYASLLTSYNPEFMFSNAFRDLETALINVGDVENLPKGTRTKIVKDALTLKSVRGAWQAMRGNPEGSEYAEAFEEFRLAGGKISFMEFNDIDRIRKRITSSLNEGKLRRALRSAAEFVEDANSAVENAARLSVYKALRDGGVSKDRAAFVARELTVNFNRKGEWGPTINSLYLFFNASTQGIVRMAQAASRSKAVRAALVSILISGALLDALNYMMAGDDDDGENLYDKIPQWVKDRNIIIMNPWGKDYIMIPMAYGYNTPFIAGQEMMAMLRGKSSPLQAASRITAATIDAFNPLGATASFWQLVSPTFLDPGVQLLENKTWYGGPIKPMKFDKRVPDSETYYSTAPWWAIDVAKFFNEATGGSVGRSGYIDVSPETIQHFTDFMTGGVGKFIQNFANTGERIAHGEEFVPEKAPFLRRMYGKTTSVSRLREFYEAWGTVDQAMFEVKKLQKAGDREKAKEVRESSKYEIAAYGQMKAAQKQLKKLRNLKNKINLDRDMSREERKQRLDEIKSREDAVVLRALKAYKSRMEEKSKAQ